MVIGFWWERLHSIAMQNKHYFTSSAMKFYTNNVDKNAWIKPSAKSKQNICMRWKYDTQQMLPYIASIGVTYIPVELGEMSDTIGLHFSRTWAKVPQSVSTSVLTSSVLKKSPRIVLNSHHLGWEANLLSSRPLALPLVLHGSISNL